MPGASERNKSEVGILSRVFAADRGNWSREVAEAILAFDLPAGDVQRMNGLAARARAGSLSEEEERELENYRQAGRVLELLHSKARISLRGPAAGAT